MQMLCGVAIGTMPLAQAQAFWFSSKKDPLSEDKSIFTLKGDVRVNGEPANKNTRIRAGDSVRTGRESEVVFAVGGDSLIMRPLLRALVEGQTLMIDTHLA